MSQEPKDLCGKCGAKASYECRATLRGAEFRGRFCLQCFQDFKQHMAEIGVDPKFIHGGQA